MYKHFFWRRLRDRKKEGTFASSCFGRYVVLYNHLSTHWGTFPLERLHYLHGAVMLNTPEQIFQPWLRLWKHLAIHSCNTISRPTISNCSVPGIPMPKQFGLWLPTVLTCSSLATMSAKLRKVNAIVDTLYSARWHIFPEANWHHSHYKNASSWRSQKAQIQRFSWWPRHQFSCGALVATMSIHQIGDPPDLLPTFTMNPE